MFNRFEIDLLIDVAAGCALNCSDCVIPRQDQLHGKGIEQLEKLVNDAQDFWLGNFWLGPTDIWHSSQRELRLDPALKRMAQRFAGITFSTTLRYNQQQMIDIADEIAEHYPHPRIKIAVPLELDVYDHEAYSRKLKRNVDTFKTLLQQRGLDLSRVYLIGNMPAEPRDFDADIFERVREVYSWLPGMDLALNAGRDDPLTLLRTIRTTQKFFNERGHLPINLPNALDHEGRGVDLLYRNGSLYYLPFYHERKPVIDDSLKLFKNRTWTQDNLYQEVVDIMQHSLTRIEQLPECRSCQYRDRCSLFCVPHIMDYCKTTHCIMPVSAWQTKIYIEDQMPR